RCQSTSAPMRATRRRYRPWPIGTSEAMGWKPRCEEPPRYCWLMAAPTGIPVPRWVDSNAKLVRGLDLLALRRTAARIAESLLDGVTTITPTVRYLSFLCWITRSYWHARKPNKRREYLAFARRVEAAIVLGNLLQPGKKLSMVGSDDATRVIESGID